MEKIKPEDLKGKTYEDKLKEGTTLEVPEVQSYESSMLPPRVYLSYAIDEMKQKVERGEILPSVAEYKLEKLAEDYKYKYWMDRTKNEWSQYLSIYRDAFDKPEFLNQYYEHTDKYGDSLYTGPLTAEQQKWVDETRRSMFSERDAKVANLNQRHGTNYTYKDWFDIDNYLSTIDDGTASRSYDTFSLYTPGFSGVSPHYRAGQDVHSLAIDPKFQEMMQKYPEVIGPALAAYGKTQRKQADEMVSTGSYFLPYIGQAHMLYDAAKEVSQGKYGEAAIDFVFGASGGLEKLGAMIGKPWLALGKDTAALENYSNAVRSGRSLGTASKITSTPFGKFASNYGLIGYMPTTFGKATGWTLSNAPSLVMTGMAGKGAYGLVKDNLFENDLTPEELKSRNIKNGIYTGLGTIEGLSRIPILAHRNGGKLKK